MKLAVLMDPLTTLKPYKDSSVAMIQSAQKLGWNCFSFTSKDLYCQDGCAFATVAELKIGHEKAPNWVEIISTSDRALSDFDVILVRKDPPFTLEYVYALHALELAEQTGVLVLNKPQGIRDSNEKMVTMHFPQCCPATLVTSDCLRLSAFWKQHREVIFKPLDGMGGQGIFHVSDDGRNLAVILEQLTKRQTVTIMAQQYIPAIHTTGDKRILLIDGIPIPYALARTPASGESRGNLVAGGSGKVVALTDRDRWICEQIGPVLRAKGLSFVGIDVIGDYLTEINVTSPTCIREISTETGVDIAGEYMNFISRVVQPSKKSSSL